MELLQKATLKKMSRHMGGGARQCHQMSHGGGGGGSKIGQKSVMYYLNGP